MGTEGPTWALTLVPPEEAVNEVKRQAMDEVQKAVAEAEQKAFEMITAERAKMEKTLAEAKKKATEDAIQVINEQEDSSEVSVAFLMSHGRTHAIRMHTHIFLAHGHTFVQIGISLLLDILRDNHSHQYCIVKHKSIVLYCYIVHRHTNTNLNLSLFYALCGKLLSVKRV